ncbi:alpha/beta hydrolase family protein [Paraglaciecola psychrophila]|uniref:Peptidase S15 n=1 Tax=Paraglaciecola psychrophila 170 TaxID=1129794 RepID=K7A4L2_9ALTE|nr:prolyl oligopeptidase family serine peptidase [Paraglaciecola psychrophila]AGH43874.1 peptidase S15 [Paraglaciecola psychrophila 170]GAC37282.1 hypothetical protein GPSY_1653 [Paraglaciecola psychrophila 170]
MFNRLFSVAENGFAVIGTQYRGAFDKEVVLGNYDEFGGTDVEDVVKLLSLIPNIDGVDSNRLSIYGSSRGGMQTFIALQEIPRVKTVAVNAITTDLLRVIKI